MEKVLVTGATGYIGLTLHTPTTQSGICSKWFSKVS